MAGALVPTTWNSHNINDLAIYKARFSTPRGGLTSIGSYTTQPVEAERKGNFPVGAFRQPTAKNFEIEVQLLRNTQADLEALKAWFSPTLFKDTEAYLTATAEDSTTRRLSCSPVSMVPTDDRQTNWHIILRASKPIWEANTATTSTRNVVASGQAFTLTNTGDELTFPTLTITPNTVKTHANDYIKRRRVALASRTEIGAMDDPEGDGYPIELSGAALSSPGDDYRLIIKGREYNRWISGNLLWANLQLQPRKKITLAAGFNGSSTADITVEEETADEGWPSAGFILFEDTNEVIQYESLGTQSFGDITRGALGTSAVSHSAAEAGYFVEHGAWVDIIYDKTSPDSPPAPVAKEPAIDLAASSNTEHVWAEPHINLDTESRSRAWQRVLTDDGLSSQHLRAYNNAGQSVFEDTLPSAGKPLGNDLSMAFPVPIRATSAAVTLDFGVGISLLLQAFVEDVEGNESRLITAYYSAGLLTAQAYNTGDELQSLRLHARIAAILGNLEATPDFYQAATTTVLTGKVKVTNSYGDDETIDPVVVNLLPGIAFNLEADTLIHAFLVNFNGVVGVGLNIYDDPPTKAIATADVPISSSALALAPPETGASSEDITLPSGRYVALFTGNAGSFGVTNARVEPAVYLVKHAEPPFEFLDSHSNYLALSDQSWWHDYQLENNSPIFAVLSRTAEPQSDAPLETGNQILLQNIDVLLDTTRAPIVNVGAELVLYLIQATLTNTTTAQSFTLFHPMTLGQTLVIDCEARTVTDGETGLPVPFAFNGDWPHLAPGSNSWSYTETGVVSTTVASSHRDRWL